MAAQDDKSDEQSIKDFGIEKDKARPSGEASSNEHNEELGPLPASETLQTTATLNSSKTSNRLGTARAYLGLHPVAPIEEEHDYAPHSDLWWPRVRIALKEPFAEFWGVFILVLFGDGGVAQVILSTGEKSAPGGDGFGNYNNINWAWALGVMLGIYVAGDSGAYLK